jgi:preprotein translocase subunit SecG
MNRKILLIGFTAILAFLMAGFAAALDYSDGDLVWDIQTEFNNIELYPFGYSDVAGFAGETVPVRISFRAIDDAEDVKIKVWMEGTRDDVESETKRFNLVDDTQYTKLLSLRLPSDLDEETEDFTLHVSISNSDGYDFAEYSIRMQRDSYVFDVLDVDYDSKTAAGDVVPVVVVVKNIGFQRADDGFVKVSIPELGVSAKGYFGDLIPTEEGCDEDTDCENEEDSVQKTVFLKIPENAEAGVYDLEVRVYNRDAETVARSLISVGDSGSTSVLAGVKNQDMSAGETKVYDLIVVNSAKSVKIFNIQTVSGSALDVSAPSVVTVGPDSSETVPITVKASSDAEVGSYTFSVDVDGQQVVFGANITRAGVSTSVVALTVVLVIIFVVLLAVLIVLLTRREKPMEEVETSYY